MRDPPLSRQRTDVGHVPNWNIRRIGIALGTKTPVNVFATGGERIDFDLGKFSQWDLPMLGTKCGVLRCQFSENSGSNS